MRHHNWSTGGWCSFHTGTPSSITVIRKSKVGLLHSPVILRRLDFYISPCPSSLMEMWPQLWQRRQSTQTNVAEPRQSKKQQQTNEQTTKHQDKLIFWKQQSLFNASFLRLLIWFPLRSNYFFVVRSVHSSFLTLIFSMTCTFICSVISSFIFPKISLFICS